MLLLQLIIFSMARKDQSYHFVILTYRPDMSLLEENLKLLRGQNVLVVDNSESAEIQEKLRGVTKGKAELVINEKNLGYTGGMNVGMKVAFGNGAEWVVLLNDDVELSTEAVEKIEEFCKTATPCVAGPYPGYLDKKRWTTILPKYAKEEQKTDYISGSCMVIHKDVNAKVQGFYKDFFMYYEDVDYCVQATKFGFALVTLALPNIHHEEGKTIERGSPLHEYYLARNHLLFVERQAPFYVKMRELIRLPKTLYEHQIFFNTAGKQGVLDFLFLRYGKARKNF
jgi:GT2 family glycosyltransferase